MPATKTPKKQNKSSFIRSQPASMSTADVIAKGKAEGIKFTSSLVYMVRGKQDGKAVPKKAAAKKPSSARKPTPAKSTESKADFVRARGHLSPKEIVADGKTHGVKLDPSYVYKVRGYDTATANRKARAASKKNPSKKRAVTTPTATASASKPSTASTNGTRATDTSVEDLLRAAAAELGLGRAIEILQGERARVRVVIGG